MAAPPEKIRNVALALWGLSVLVLGALIVGVLVQRSAPPPLPELAQVPDFSLTDRKGGTVTRAELSGNPWIADFIFTRCAAICPRMTAEMRKVQKALGPSSPVKIASFSVDPEFDTPEVLDEFANAHNAGDGWYFLTGETQQILSLCRDGFLLPAEAAPESAVAQGNDPIIHSNRFVLVDGRHQIRGYYDPFLDGDMERLLGDVKRLLREG